MRTVYSEEMVAEYAVNEWFAYYQPKSDFKKTKIAAVLNCFCVA